MFLSACPIRRQHGITMIEVLLTIVIIVFGLLGLAALHAKSTLAQAESYQRAQALLLMGDMADRISANRIAAGSYAKGTAAPLGTGDSQPASCAGMLPGVARDECEWSNALKGAAERKSGANVGAMIGARGCVEQIQIPDTTIGVCAPGIYRVSVAWQGLNPTSAPTLACGANQYGAAALQRTVSTSIVVGLLGCS
jgi:type IV pilus assembly protein PilV